MIANPGSSYSMLLLRAICRSLSSRRRGPASNSPDGNLQRFPPDGTHTDLPPLIFGQFPLNQGNHASRGSAGPAEPPDELRIEETIHQNGTRFGNQRNQSVSILGSRPLGGHNLIGCLIRLSGYDDIWLGMSEPSEASVRLLEATCARCGMRRISRFHIAVA